MREPDYLDIGEITRGRAIKLAGAALVASALGMFAAPSARATSQYSSNVVYIKDFYFSPASISVQPGTAVTWVNAGDVDHTVTSYDGQFDSGVLMPGDWYTVKFFGYGTISYYCAIHPDMTGSVGVGVPAQAASGSYAPMGGGHMSMGGGY